jgi:cell division protein FtsN
VEGVKYQLHVGDYTSEESLADAKAKVRKAGFSAVVKRQGEKRMTMNRLYHSSHGDKNSAEQALAMLKKEIDGPFILRENGKYVVYAGSYQNEQTALGEQERLSLLGTTLVLRKADVKLPVSRLTTGSFPSKEAAQKGGARLKKMGLHPSVQRAR